METEPKWYILHLANYFVAMVFVSSVFYHIRGAGQKRDATAILPVLLIWCACMAYFFGFFGISFVDKDEDLFFSPLSDELATIPEEEDDEIVVETNRIKEKAESKHTKEENSIALIAAGFRRQTDAVRGALALNLKRHCVHLKVNDHDVFVPFTAEFLTSAAATLRLSGGTRTTHIIKPSTYTIAAAFIFPKPSDALLALQNLSSSHYTLSGRNVFFQSEPQKNKDDIKLPHFSKAKLCASRLIQKPETIQITAELMIPGPVLRRTLHVKVSELYNAYTKTVDQPHFQPPNAALNNLFAPSLALGPAPSLDFFLLEPISAGRDLRVSCALSLDTSLLEHTNSSLALQLVQFQEPSLAPLAVSTALADALQHYAALCPSSPSVSPEIAASMVGTRTSSSSSSSGHHQHYQQLNDLSSSSSPSQQNSDRKENNTPLATNTRGFCPPSNQNSLPVALHKRSASSSFVHVQQQQQRRSASSCSK